MVSLRRDNNETELEVMKILWQKQEATSAEIIEELKDKSDWKPKTIQTLITRLVSKEVVQVDKSNKKSYIYSPTVSEDEYKDDASKSFLEKLYSGSINKMVLSFVKSNKLSKSEIEELKDMLKDE
ncbi:beta-lactamase [Terrisporobacter othiniensis]|uniref:Beta-lactamase n=1 Tax=Terrisporobacter othiniensis TaxID=1577792 RepID=A0A0B3W821_9FIRM|nr:BlaI/MecI/CopY family transcriptional regulator [Terrisporobacter othiniensis]KHS58562.1 beta-lactamase [Terrisporobacter othiniensis]